MKIIAQLFGLGAMISLFMVNQQKQRKNLIMYKMITDLCWSFHYLCLGAFGGMIPNFVGIFREIVFINRGTKKWASLSFWPVLFICINWFLGFWTFASLINILPIIGSTLVTFSLWLKRTELIKMLLLITSLLFLIYDLFVGSWVGVISESIAILSIIIFYMEFYFKNERKIKNEK